MLTGHDPEEVQEVEAVDIGLEDRRVVDAMRRDVEDPVRKAAAEEPCHRRFDGSAPMALISRLRAFCHTIGTPP